ncbi:MAG: hypothetical protein ABJC89_17075 [Acidobacteriota bacterium]
MLFGAGVWNASVFQVETAFMPLVSPRAPFQTANAMDVLANLTGAPLVPCFIRRAGRGRFFALPGRPVDMRTDLPRDAAIQAAAQDIADQLAEQIRLHPECWYQFYRYWDAQRDDYTGLD